MKTNYLKHTLAWVLAVSYFGQITAGTAVKASAVKIEASFTDKWNNVSSSWPKNHSERQIKSYLRTLGVKYNTRFEKEDSAYLKSQLLQTAHFPSIQQTDTGMILTVKKPQELKLEITKMTDTGFTVNGKVFTYNTQMTLEQNKEVLSGLLSDGQKVSFLDNLFMPQAYAGIGDWIAENPGWSALIAGALVAGLIYFGLEAGNEGDKPKPCNSHC